MEPDIKEALKAVSKNVGDTLIGASRQLTDMGIQHVVVGAISVGAYGAPRATTDVDFMVSRDHYIVTKTGLVYLKDRVPYSGPGNTRIDYVDVPIPDSIIEYAFKHARMSCGIPVAPVEIVILMKLISPRMKDSGDIEEMLKHGMNVKPIRDFLVKTNIGIGIGIGVVDKFDTIVLKSREE